jgi:hypothetical protein
VVKQADVNINTEVNKNQRKKCRILKVKEKAINVIITKE